MKINFLLILATNLFLFSACQSQHQQSIYLGGWEVTLNGDKECQKFIQTQAVDKKTASNLWSSIELIFEDNKLVEAYDYEEGYKTTRPLKRKEKGMKYQDVVPHQMFEIDEAEQSDSYLGDECPTDFTLPKLDFIAPFQYLGFLSNKDEAFRWLPFDLHLAAPIYLNFQYVMLDYSDPNKPVVLNLKELEEAGNSYEDELKVDSEIVFEKMNISTQKVNDYGAGIGHTGIPSWIQYPDIPTCPKSKKTMKFLMQLTSNIGIKTKRSNVSSESDWMLQYFDHLNFWSDGDLYIFFEPESKVICYIIQNT